MTATPHTTPEHVCTLACIPELEALVESEQERANDNARRLHVARTALEKIANWCDGNMDMPIVPTLHGIATAALDDPERIIQGVYAGDGT